MSGGERTSRLELAAAALAALALCLGSPARAEPIHGRIEVQDTAAFAREDSLDAALGARNRNDLAADLRLTWEPSWDRWSFSVHYNASASYGDSARLARARGPLTAPPATLVDLEDTFADDGHLTGSHRIDRLALTYSTAETVVRVGRQALTWGSGLVFRPMDLFNPFSPTATDTEYKPGVDMIYVQRLFADGSDVQLIVVPRPPRRGARASSDASSAAAHLHTTIAGRRTTWLLARDHGDWVAAVGVNGALGGATWNLEVVPTFLDGGGTRVSGLANISYSATLMRRNATLFAEYFHNGFGARERNFDVASLPPELLDRLSRGQLFSTRRNYLSAGMTLEVNPLLNAGPTVIANLDDGSVLLLASATVSLGDNLTLVAGAQAPIGGHRTEFGGLPLAPASQTFVAPPARLYLQLRRYF
ncbi:hypothetical protein [uncultured Phenylobacterium sp.]|uniref:hypothetical protein n=1 Tax=uncultured Phenylobacterium sp. TaxID=349273 RepID=UPI0025E0D99A|nr:hypothetical protein [uncultured Phenylobacterium sp.]